MKNQTKELERLREELKSYLWSVEPQIAQDIRGLMRVRGCVEAYIEEEAEYFRITRLTQYGQFKDVESIMYIRKDMARLYKVRIDYVSRDGETYNIGTADILHVYGRGRRLCYQEITVNPHGITLDMIEDLVEAQGV